MTEQNNPQNEEKKKGFFANIMDKLDKKVEAKSKEKGCCCSQNNDKGDSCC